MKATTTYTTGAVNPHCPQCGLPYYAVSDNIGWWGIVPPPMPPTCRCRVEPTWIVRTTRPANTTGWECPRCGAVNAPHVDRCDCAAPPA